jgi:very-short-patch-repair endonuclease
MSGACHNEATAECETVRDAALASEGITVLRLSEAEVTSGDLSRPDALLVGI